MFTFILLRSLLGHRGYHLYQIRFLSYMLVTLALYALPFTSEGWLFQKIIEHINYVDESHAHLSIACRKVSDLAKFLAWKI